MRAGLTDSDAYLRGMAARRAGPVPDNLDGAVAEAVATLERTYDAERLKRLIDNGGKNGG